VCNNSLFDDSMRRKFTGAKQAAEDATKHIINYVLGVGEHSIDIEAGSARTGRVYRRENVGMSNRKAAEKAAPRKSKVSVAMAINHGLDGPKAMAKAAADGQPVNIPALLLLLMG